MKELRNWFQKNQREFPWRENRTPYKVWISEVMLQQTRASVVVSYFNRWLSLFPDVKTLASASLEQVIKAWEGLGYYSRARNLHAGAQQIVERFHGEIPSSREDLESIRGLGPYTIGALLSFGFRQKAAAVDGNVTRVLARYYCIEENVCRQPTKRLIQTKAEELLDGPEPWVISEALIELGATVCSPKPRCEICPLQKGCLGFREKKADSLPIKNSQEKAVELRRLVVVIEAQGKVLLRKGEAGRVMADLYEFPYFETGKERESHKKWVQRIHQEFRLQVELVRPFPEVKHTFTRYSAFLSPLLLRCSFLQEVEGLKWVSRDQLLELPFSSGHRKIVHEYLSPG